MDTSTTDGHEGASLSVEAARAALSDAQGVAERTRRALSERGGDWIMMIWGAIWIVGYGGMHLWPRATGWVWLALDVAGIAATITIAFRAGRRDVKAGATTRRMNWRMFWSWLLLFCYADVWLLLLWPFDGLQIGAFVATLVMFAYVLMGLWLGDWLFITLGLAVTALTLVGYLLFREVFGWWMAGCGGGALLGGGMYVRLRWRRAWADSTN